MKTRSILFLATLLTFSTLQAQRNASNQGVTLRLISLVIRQDSLWIHVKIRNHSLIPYRWTGLRVFTRDRHAPRRTAVQEQEIIPLDIPPLTPVAGDSTMTFTIVCQSLTVAPEKDWVMELTETPGTRTLWLRLRARQYLRHLRKG